MELTFGEIYDRLTSSALDEIRARLRPPASIVDFGAGCGRLSIPLSRAGYEVTAVDPSGAMLDQLRARAPSLEVETVETPMQRYRARRPHDLALCVFTVIAYILDEETLSQAFTAAAQSLVPDGLLLLDVPQYDMFESFDHDTESIIRHVEIEPIAGPVHAYHERTVLRTPDGSIQYEDTFRIRHWTLEETLVALDAVGFVPADDISARFTGLGANYLLMRRSG
jgi:SAM-dependent methyltransferase